MSASVNALASSAPTAGASTPNKQADALAAGENFGEQLLQLLLAGDAPVVSAEAGKSPKLADKATDEVATTDGDAPVPLLPGLSLLIQQMASSTDTQTEASTDTPIAAATLGAGAATGLADLLEQLGASANDDASVSMLDPTAMSVLTQTPQPQAPSADNNVAPTVLTPLHAANAEHLAESLDEQITWLADAARKDGPQQATISLHPAEWGSLQIRVDLAQDGRTTVKFDCETPQARQAIEASLSQLRELLSTTVVTGAAPRFELSGGFGHQQSGHWKPAAQTSHGREDSERVDTMPITRRGLGLLDQFA